MPEDCLFCKIVAGKVPAEKVDEDESLLAFRDIDPKAPTHVLVIPKVHIASLDALSASYRDLMGHLMTRIPEIARGLGLVEGGYRVVANCGAGAGQSVFHIHFHILGGRPMKWPPG